MKYELTTTTKDYYGIKLYQIKALKDFGNVKKGELGGWIEKEANLSQDGVCWVSDNAWVSDDAQVYGNAKVYGDAWVYDNAHISGDAWVYGNAKVFGSARVYDGAQIFGSAHICGNARISGNARVYDDARVYGNAKVSGGFVVNGNTIISAGVHTTSVANTLVNVLAQDEVKEELQPKAQVCTCSHPRKYINNCGPSIKFWVCPDCKADLGNA